MTMHYHEWDIDAGGFDGARPQIEHRCGGI